MLKILIYDENFNDLSMLCDMIRLLPIDYQIDTVSSYAECTKIYTKDRYNIIFIDFATNTGKDILSYILEQDQKQRVITISEEDSCSGNNGCTDCLEKYNKFRVVKPIKQNELLNIMLKNELCFSYCNQNLLLQLEILSKKLTSLTLNKHTLFFKNNADSYHRVMTETIQLINDLENKDISFQLLNDGIQIIQGAS